MRERKFTFNALVLIVLIFTAIGLFITVHVVDLANRPAINVFEPIEGTDLSVRYSSLLPDGLYIGDIVTGEMKVAGTFGYDWGAAVEGNNLYLNEYVTTDLGTTFCHLVRVDLTTYRKEVIMPDTLLRGRCASGELVCLRGALLPADHPQTNAFCHLYALTDDAIRPETDGAEVTFLDPATGQTVYTVRDDRVMDNSFDARYLARTLQEVRK